MNTDTPESDNKKNDLPRLFLAGFLGVLIGVGFSYFSPHFFSLIRGQGWRSNLASVNDFTQHEGHKETDRVIVKFTNGQTETQKQQVFLSMKGKEVKRLKGGDIVVVKIGNDDTADEVAGRVRSVYGSRVLYAEPDALIAPEYIPNDPEISNEWHVQQMNVPSAWDSTQGEGVTIAILDTGVDCTHQDLAANCLPGWNTVSNSSDATDIYGHGTMVAGVAGGVGDNTLEVAGIAYRSKLLPVRVSNDATAGYAYLSDIAAGIYYAADNGAKVVNISYQTGDSTLIQDAAAYLYQKGGLTIVAAGNDGTRIAALNTKEIITVSGTVYDDTKAAWSSYGPAVDIAAPGLGIYTTGRGGTLAAMSGTSASAPSVAGVVALLYAFRPTSTPLEVSNYLFTSALDLGAAGYDEYYGWGRVDAGAALLLASSATSAPVYVPSSPVVPSGPLSMLSYAVTQKTATTATISWSTSISAIGFVRYGLTQTGMTYESSALVAQTAQLVTLTELTPRTKYFYQIVGTDTSGKTAVTSIGTFRTASK